MDIVELKNFPLLKKLAVAAGSQKEKAILAPASDAVQLRGTYWDGDTRYDFFRIRIETMEVLELPHTERPTSVTYQSPIQTLAPGLAVVRTGVINGRPASPVIFLHQADHDTVQRSWMGWDQAKAREIEAADKLKAEQIKEADAKKLRTPLGWGMVEGGHEQGYKSPERFGW